MNISELEKKLMAAARSRKPDDRVPLAFEKRIMARLGSGQPDLLGVWAQWLWRGAAASVGVMLVLGAIALFHPAPAAQPDLAQDFEQTMLAAVDTESGL
ncbi:MAG: hypothetical protein U1F98_08350 [Verrucomicrobiota bacterium]